MSTWRPNCGSAGSPLEECPASHRLSDDLTSYAAIYGAYSPAAELTCDADALWAAERSFSKPMLVPFSQVASEALVAGLATESISLATPLLAITGRGVGVRDESANSESQCVVATLGAVSSETQINLPIKYVYNACANAELTTRGGQAVGDFGAYVSTAHHETTDSFQNWAGWGHWLDAHTSLFYGMEYNPDATRTSVYMNKVLLVSGVSAAQRTNPSGTMAHRYTGFEGPLSVEFMVSPESSYDPSFNNDADICTCRDNKNLNRYVVDTGTDCSTVPVVDTR